MPKQAAGLPQLRFHVERLCADNDIDWQIDSRHGAISTHEFGEIVTPPIRGCVSYAVALHEIGHILGRYQGERYHTLVRETWAWRWAEKHALIWTPAMARNADRCLKWYRQHARRIDRKRAGLPTVDEQLAAYEPKD